MTILLCDEVVVDPPLLPDVVESPGGVEVIVGPPVLEATQVSELPEQVLVDPPVLPEVGVSHGGPPGPPGPQGPAGTQTVIRTAAVNLSARRVVVSDATGVHYADLAQVADGMKSTYFTTTSALAGEEVTLLTFGEVVEPTWSWTPGVPLYLTPNGIVSETAPTGVEFVRIVAWTEAATKILFNPQPPIYVV